jgi:hypothetical protein
VSVVELLCPSLFCGVPAGESGGLYLSDRRVFRAGGVDGSDGNVRGEVRVFFVPRLDVCKGFGFRRESDGLGLSYGVEV